MLRPFALTISAAIPLTLLAGSPGIQAQSKSCPQVVTCFAQCISAHRACRADRFTPIFVCERNRQTCELRCKQAAAKGACGPRPT